MLRGFDLLIGGGLIAVLAFKAPVALVCGLACVWWGMRKRPELTVADAIRIAMLGGAAGHFLLIFGLLWLYQAGMPGDSLPSASGWTLVKYGPKPLLTAIVFALGLYALLPACLLGLAVKLLGPWLPR